MQKILEFELNEVVSEFIIEQKAKEMMQEFNNGAFNINYDDSDSDSDSDGD